MSDQSGPSKRPTAMPDHVKKRLKSIESEEFLLNSDDDFYGGSDIDDIYCESSDSESEEDEVLQLQGNHNNEVVNEEQMSFNQISVRPIFPSTSATPFAITASLDHQCPPDQPLRAVSMTCWSTDDFSSMREIPFTRTNALLVPAPNNPRDYFDLFISEDYLQKIVDCSNRYAENLKNSSNQVQSRITQWKSLTVEELKVFIGLLLHTSTAKMNRIVDYWKVHRLYKSVFPEYMSRNRFQIILRCLNFTDEPNYPDRMNKCKLIIDNFNNVMECIYYPGKNLSLDELMILWRGRLIFRQYIKGKRYKYGIRMNVLAEPNGIILKVHVFDSAAGKSHTEKIVEKLLEGKLNAGHAVYMDSFYNSYDLAAKLLEQNTYCTGTLNKKLKDNPDSIITKKLEKGENVSQCRNGVHIGKWKDKREINYISTEFPDELYVTNIRGTVVTKPAAIISYNKYMSGVGLQDQMLSYYPCERKTLRWYTKIFLHTLMMSLINARVLYNKYSNQKTMQLYDFREKIIESYLPEKTSNPQTTRKKTCGDGDQHKLTKVEKVTPRFLSNGKTINATSRKDCRNCYKNKKRVNTTTECKMCPGSPPLCFECFFELHDVTAK